MEEIDSSEGLIDAQEWFIESCMEASKENKRKAKQRVFNYRKDLEAAHIRIRKVEDLPNTRDATSSQIKEMLKVAAEVNSGINDSYGSGQAIQSKEYTRSGDDPDWNASSEKEGMISLKMRLLHEDEQKDIELVPNRDEDVIEEGSIFNNHERQSKQRRNSNSQNSEEPLISEAQLSML